MHTDWEINIGDREYEVKVARTQEEKEQGLQGITELDEDEGMLFVFDPPEDVFMWMKGTLIPLDIVFINPDNKVTFIGKGQPESTDKITVPNTKYVLEVNIDSEIKEGDTLEIESEDDKPVMKVLAQDGSTQMELYGGERIFRRTFTKQLIKWAKKANEVKNSSEDYNRICIRIGKKMFKEIKSQDERDPEYVNLPES